MSNTTTTTKVYSSPTRAIYVVKIDGKAIGTVGRFDRGGAWAAYLPETDDAPEMCVGAEFEKMGHAVAELEWFAR